MEKIVARWEWRTFGNTFGQAEEGIRKYEQAGLKKSAEIYILSTESHNNTKIRDELMDIKTLQQINDDGLEQWSPVMKAGFPAKSAMIKEICGHWQVDDDAVTASSYTFERFLNDVVKPNEALRTVDVFKERLIYSIDETIVEIAELKFDDQPIRTVAVEMADPVRVMDVVRKLGLEKFENINYIKALKKHAGMA